MYKKTSPPSAAGRGALKYAGFQTSPGVLPGSLKEASTSALTLVLVFHRMGSCSADELWTRAEANGYSQGAHTEQDQVRGKGKHGKKAIQNHDGTLNRYVL